MRDVGLGQSFVFISEKECFYMETSKKGAWELPVAMCVSEGERTNNVTCPRAGSQKRFTVLFHQLGGL